MSMFRPEQPLHEKAQDLLLMCAVRKQMLEPLRGSKLFGRWARGWIETYDEIIAVCVYVLKQWRRSEYMYFMWKKNQEKESQKMEGSLDSQDLPDVHYK